MARKQQTFRPDPLITEATEDCAGNMAGMQRFGDGVSGSNDAEGEGGVGVIVRVRCMTQYYEEAK